MALNSGNVRVAVTGAIYSDPTGTATAPVDADAALGASFVDHGYVSEDGVTEATNRTVEQIRAWQNASVVRETVTEGEATYAFTLIETKRENVELYYADTVDTATGGIDVRPTVVGARRMYVLDVIDGDDFIRTVILAGEIQERGEQVYANGQPIGYTITLKAYEDADGVAARKYYSSLKVTV